MPVGGGGILRGAVGMVNARGMAGYARECKVRGKQLLSPHSAWVSEATLSGLII